MAVVYEDNFGYYDLESDPDVWLPRFSPSERRPNTGRQPVSVLLGGRAVFHRLTTSRARLTIGLQQDGLAATQALSRLALAFDEGEKRRFELRQIATAPPGPPPRDFMSYLQLQSGARPVPPTKVEDYTTANETALTLIVALAMRDCRG